MSLSMFNYYLVIEFYKMSVFKMNNVTSIKIFRKVIQ